jgi:predicted RNase H-like nuclease
LVKLCRTFTELVWLRVDTDAPLAVDVPIGLLESVDFRPCDLAARRLLGLRRSSVFAPPSRPLLTEHSYPQARAHVEWERRSAPEAKGLSAQAFGIAPKVDESDRWLRAHPESQAWLYECHPELSFWAAAGRRPLGSKMTLTGHLERLRLVTAFAPDWLEAAARAGLADRDATIFDVLDAYAALWTALRLRDHREEILGGERDRAGVPMRIAY